MHAPDLNGLMACVDAWALQFPAETHSWRGHSCHHKKQWNQCPLFHAECAKTCGACGEIGVGLPVAGNVSSRIPVKRKQGRSPSVTAKGQGRSRMIVSKAPRSRTVSAKGYRSRSTTCSDSPGWTNGPRPGGALDCAAYEVRGYCKDGGFVGGFEWTGGPRFNHPERACCACGKRAAASEAPGRCRCSGASVCTAAALGSFMMRMPASLQQEGDEAIRSPWVWYLSKVYRSTSLPLASINLSSLEAFYPALLPVAPCTSTGSSTALPLCSLAECEAWLPRRELPNAVEVARFVANRSFIRVAAQAGNDSRPFGHIVALQRPSGARRPSRISGARLEGRSAISRSTRLSMYSPKSRVKARAMAAVQASAPPSAVPSAVVDVADVASAAPSQWVEVTRSVYQGEGRADYGCWFHPAVGSGVFVRPGALLSWATRKAASAAVRAWTGHVPGGLNHDADLPRLARRKGFSSFEILISHGRPVGWWELGDTTGTHELVLLTRACMGRGARGTNVSQGSLDRAGGLLTACVPDDVDLRTGWHASRPQCKCDQRQFPEVLNCAATPVVASTRTDATAPSELWQKPILALSDDGPWHGSRSRFNA